MYKIFWVPLIMMERKIIFFALTLTKENKERKKYDMRREEKEYL